MLQKSIPFTHALVWCTPSKEKRYLAVVPDNDFFACRFLCVVIRTRRRHRRTRPRAGTQKEMDCTRVYAGVSVRESARVVCASLANCNLPEWGGRRLLCFISVALQLRNEKAAEVCVFDRPPLAARRRIPAIGFPVSHLGSANIYLQFFFARNVCRTQRGWCEVSGACNGSNIIRSCSAPTLSNSGEVLLKGYTRRELKLAPRRACLCAGKCSGWKNKKSLHWGRILWD